MEKRISLRVRRIVKVCLFFVLLIGLLHGVAYLVRPGADVRRAQTRSQESVRVFAEPDNSLDVLFFGHSGVYSALAPMEMYKEYGFTSYDCSQPAQLPWESERWLRALLARQSPAAVVFEVDQLFYDKNVTVARNSAERLLYTAFPVLKNHWRWKHWFGGRDAGERSATKGFYYNTSVRPYKGKKHFERAETVYAIGKKQMQALEGVRLLCAKRGIPLLLLEVPSLVVWDGSRYNAVRGYAERHGLDFIDLNQRLEEMAFDWKTDTRDKGDHLNYSGARKVSHYLGGYLKGRYALADRRDDPAYETWKEDLRRYEEILREGGKE